MNNQWVVFSSSLTARQQALRVKVLRRLAAIGAVPLKNSLWLLPGRDVAHTGRYLTLLIWPGVYGGKTSRSSLKMRVAL